MSCVLSIVFYHICRSYIDFKFLKSLKTYCSNIVIMINFVDTPFWPPTPSLKDSLMARLSLRKSFWLCNWTQQSTGSETPRSSSRLAFSVCWKRWEMNVSERSSLCSKLISVDTSSASNTKSSRTRGIYFFRLLTATMLLYIYPDKTDVFI